jgi:hypothetical protein
MGPFFGEFGMGNWDAWMRMRMRIVFGIFFRLETWIENWRRARPAVLSAKRMI